MNKIHKHFYPRTTFDSSFHDLILLQPNDPKQYLIKNQLGQNSLNEINQLNLDD